MPFGEIKCCSGPELATCKRRAALGMHVGAHVAHPRAQLQRSVLAAVPAATAIVPYKKYVPPADLDGSGATVHRARSLMAASATMRRFGAWLAAERPGESEEGPKGDLSSTHRLYRSRKPSVCCYRSFLADPSADLERPGITSAGRRGAVTDHPEKLPGFPDGPVPREGTRSWPLRCLQIRSGRWARAGHRVSRNGTPSGAERG